MKENTFVNVSFIGDAEMQKLNKKYRGKDKTTDVLSFNINEELHLGDIVVNIDQAKRQAGEYKNTLEEEIAELVAHGMLHLQGVHHEHDE